MAAKRNKRARFGTTRQLPSGRWQARYTDKAGRRHTCDETFPTDAAARRWLSAVETDIARGGWVDPDGGRVTLAMWCDEWLALHPELAPRTVELYRGLIRRYIAPTLGHVTLSNLAPSTVRAWHADLVRTAPTSVPPKAYRVLRAMLNTAVADELILRNPCTLKGAGAESSPERPIATPEQVWALADAIGDRWRAMVLLAAGCGLRFGELAGLARRHLDLGDDAGQVVDLDAARRRRDTRTATATVTVERALVQLQNGKRFVGPPKSDAGRRTIAVPPPLVPHLADHLDRFAEPGPDGLVFVGERGGLLARGNWNPVWNAARAAVTESHNLPPGFHFHDLRHTSNTVAASTGASTRELMHRMGHASPAAALRYQHATAERDAAIADAVGDALRPPATGTA